VVISNDPTDVVLGFDDENAVAGNQAVIDLCGSIAYRYDHTVKASVTCSACQKGLRSKR